jgi:hypothetical protein
MEICIFEQHGEPGYISVVSDFLIEDFLGGSVSSLSEEHGVR